MNMALLYIDGTCGRTVQNSRSKIWGDFEQKTPIECKWGGAHLSSKTPPKLRDGKRFECDSMENLLRFAVDVAEFTALAPELARGATRREEDHPNGAVGALLGGFGGGTAVPLALQLCNGGVVDFGSELGPHVGVHHSGIHTIHVHHSAVVMGCCQADSVCQQASVRIPEDFGKAVGMAISSCCALIASLAHLLVSLGQLVQQVLIERRGVDQLVFQALIRNILQIKHDTSKSSRGGLQERKERLREVFGSVVIGVNCLHSMLVCIVYMQHCSIVDLDNTIIHKLSHRHVHAWECTRISRPPKVCLIQEANSVMDSGLEMSSL